jgi:hypothetical protein
LDSYHLINAYEFILIASQDFGFLSSSREQSKSSIPGFIICKEQISRTCGDASSSRPLEGDPLTLAVRVGFKGLVTATINLSIPAPQLNHEVKAAPVQS